MNTRMIRPHKTGSISVNFKIVVAVCLTWSCSFTISRPVQASNDYAALGSKLGIPEDAIDKLADEKFIQSEMCQLPEETRVNLTKAAETNDLATVKFFIEEKGIPVTEKMNNPGEKLVHIAVRHGSIDVVKYLLEKEPSLLSETDQHGFDVLHIAIEEGLLPLVQYLVEKCDANVDEANKRNFRGSALHSAVEYGHLDIVKYLIEKRHVNVNQLTFDSQEEPPLFLAVRYRQGDVAKYLMNEGKANMTIMSGRLENVLFIAVRKNDLPLMKYLLDEKKVNFDINWRNDASETLAHIASNLNRLEVLKYIVEEKHADLNIPDRWTNLTCLHYAAFRNNFDVCKYLIEHGANPQWRDKEGNLPWEKAVDLRLSAYLHNQTSARSRRDAPADLAFRPIRIGASHEMEESTYLAGYINRGGGDLENVICL